MKLLYIASVRVPSEKASGLAIMRQCEAFSIEGYDVVLLSPRFDDNIKLSAFEYYKIPTTFVLKKIWAFDFLRSKKGGFYLSRFSQMVVTFIYCIKMYKQIDVIYTRDQWMMLLPVIFLKHRLLVCEVHTKHKDWVSFFVLKRVSKLITISGGLKKYYRSQLDRSDILIEHSGVNLKQFKNIEKKEIVRIRLKLPIESVVVAYTGKYTTMGTEKGINEFIQAFAQVFKDNPLLYLLIVGLEENEVSIVTHICKEAGLPDDSFSLLALVQSDFASYLEASDILIMNYPDTEHYRNFMSPTKLFAYMASGKVIISSDLPSIREIVDESMVIFVRPGNVIDLQLKLKTVIKNLDSLYNKGIVSKDIVSKYSWSNRTARIVKYFNLT